MEILVFLAVLVLVIIWAFTRRKASRLTMAKAKTDITEPKITVSIHTDSPSNLDAPDTGPVTAAPDGGWVLNPSSTFPLTVYGIDQPAVKEVKRLLDEGYSRGTYALVDTLIPVITRSNLRCKEIDEYIQKFKLQYFKTIEDLKRSSVEWASASDKDREDLLVAFRQEAIESLDVRPFCDLETLFECEPSDTTLDDALIDRFGYENLQVYLQYAGDLDKVRVIPANHHYRAKFEILAELGLAIRGSGIPLAAILETLKLKDLKELVTDLDPPPFRKKAQAIEFLLKLPDIKERVGRVVAFRELFQLRPLPEAFSRIDLTQISTVWRYASEIASLIAHTYVKAGYATRNRRQYRGDLSYITGWELSPVDDHATCPFCKRKAGETYPKNRLPKVPLHIGCRCSVLPITPLSE